MFAQQPQNHGVPGQRHFWDEGTTAHTKINDLNYAIATDGPGAQHGRPITNLWGAIYSMYFPAYTNIPGGPVWAVDRGVNMGPSKDMEADIADIVTVKLTSPAQPTSQTRDILWVECKKAALDRPSSWKDVLEEAAKHLNSVHANRDVFLVIAIGTKCMLFGWNPSNTIQQPRLSIQSSRPGPNDAPPPVWQVDQRIKLIQNAPWADHLTGRLDPSQAYKLDCGQQQVPAWENQMGVIEAYLVGISQLSKESGDIFADS